MGQRRSGTGGSERRPSGPWNSTAWLRPSAGSSVAVALEVATATTRGPLVGSSRREARPMMGSHPARSRPDLHVEQLQRSVVAWASSLAYPSPDPAAGRHTSPSPTRPTVAVASRRELLVRTALAEQR
jgi:hypothetical protein